MSEVTDLK